MVGWIEEWVGGSVGRWVGGSVGRWVGGSVGRWVGGSVGRWVGGSVGRWVGGSDSCRNINELFLETHSMCHQPKTVLSRQAVDSLVALAVET